MAMQTDLIQAGSRVRVTQQMPLREEAWTEATEGVVVRFRQAKTGSWFAHAKDDQLWLDRLELRLDDGEITVLNLDQYSSIDVLEAAPSDEADDAGEIDASEPA